MWSSCFCSLSWITFRLLDATQAATFGEEAWGFSADVVKVSYIEAWVVGVLENSF
jgi:hypothetical protein